METEAAVLFETPKGLSIETLTIPSLKIGQVLVEVAFSGICQSQLLEVQGKRGPDRYLPHTLGHEGSGTVLEVGEGVKKVKPGDHVVLSWIKGTGVEILSMGYSSNVGVVNSGPISTFMRQTITSESRLTPIPMNIPLREAALLGCAIPTGGGMILNTAQVKSQNSLAVFGMGGIGLSALMVAKGVEPKMVIAVDLSDLKLEYARKAGATHLINARLQDSLNKILEITGGKGVDYAIEATGKREAMEAAFKSVKTCGGLCILAGNLAEGEQISINPFDLIRGKRILGTWGGETVMERDIPKYLEFYLSGKLKLRDLITHEYCLKDIHQALHDLEEGKVGRALLNMSL